MAAVRIPVSKLNIQLNTNIGGNPELFNRSMLKLPKLDEAPNANSDLPYFTKVVKYPDWIQSMPWKDRVEFFFNREIFTKTLRDELKRTGGTTISGTDPELRYKVEKRNIMITLRSLLPIPERYGNALKNSYDHILRKHSNSRIIADVDLKQALNVFGIMYRIGVLQKEREEYFLTIGGKEYDVEDIVWENDIVNHPLYFEYLVSRQKMFDSIENTKDDVLKKYGNSEKALNAELNKTTSVDAIKKQVIGVIMNTKTQMGNFDPQLTSKTEPMINNRLKNNSVAELTKRFQNSTNGGMYKDFQTAFGIGQDKAVYDAKVKECIDAIKKQDTLQSMLWNLDINVPEPSGIPTLELDKIRDRLAVKGRIKSKLESLISGPLTGDDAAKLLISVKNDLDEHEASRSERSTVFINGEYEIYFERLLKFAVQVRAAAMVKDFVEKHVPMNLTDKRITDGKDETQIVKRVNKFVRESFPTQAQMNNDQAKRVIKIYEPERKTFNANLYNILFKIKTGETPPDADKPVEPKFLDQIYATYAAIDAKPPLRTDPDLKPYLYVGVEEVKPAPSDAGKEKSELDVEKNKMEIYVWINLVDAKKMETVPKSSCKLYDKLLEQELRELTDVRHRDRMMNRYRNLDFDQPWTIKDPIDNAVKKGGGETRKLLRSFSKQTTAKNYH